MATRSYQITATPQLLERVHYAIRRCTEKPDLSAKAINAEIAAHFGKALAPSHWTVINAARRDGALDRVTVKSFDFSKHGRKARLGKTRAESSAISKRKPAGRTRKSAVVADPAKHSRAIVSVWRGGAVMHYGVASRQEAKRKLRQLLADGVPITDVAVYVLEPLNVSVALRG